MVEAFRDSGGCEESCVSFRVGSVCVRGDLVLSPMAGFSDLPYRSLCRKMGSAMSYTEFVSALAVLHGGSERTRRMLAYREAERPVVFQIFGSDERHIVEAARRLEQLGPDVIDLNMGCSVRHVSGRGAGAALLKDPCKIGRIFHDLARFLSIPVTAKIRLGWTEYSLNYLEVARVLEESGASLMAVHGRTRNQAYRGKANWDAIAEIVDAVRIPVIGNGDVKTRADIARMKAHTGCAAIMIGRGAIGHPWIFQHRDRNEVAFQEKADFLGRHFRAMIDFYGERLALLLIRKHVARYLKGVRGIRDLQQQLVRIESVPRFYELLELAKSRLSTRNTLPSSSLTAVSSPPQPHPESRASQLESRR